MEAKSLTRSDKAESKEPLESALGRALRSSETADAAGAAVIALKSLGTAVGKAGADTEGRALERTVGRGPESRSESSGPTLGKLAIWLIPLLSKSDDKGRLGTAPEDAPGLRAVRPGRPGSPRLDNSSEGTAELGRPTPDKAVGSPKLGNPLGARLCKTWESCDARGRFDARSATKDDWAFCSWLTADARGALVESTGRRDAISLFDADGKLSSWLTADAKGTSVDSPGKMDPRSLAIADGAFCS